MAASKKMSRTRTPGVYRRGDRYAITYRDHNGKQRWASARTYDEARSIKQRRDQQARDGEVHLPASQQPMLADFALDLFGADTSRKPGVEPAKGRYQGRRGAVREATRREYRRDMEHYWLPVLGSKRMPTITPPDIARALATLAARDGDDYLADGTLRRVFAPLSALMAVAAEEGVIRHNPCRDVTVPTGRDRLRRFAENQEDDDNEVKAYTRAEIATLLSVIPDEQNRTLVLLLATTGLRISEAIGLRWRDVTLDGGSPHVKVRRAIVNGTVGPPKSRHGRRSVPVTRELVDALRGQRQRTEWPRADDAVFCTSVGTPPRPENLRRSLIPFAQEADVTWLGFHGFRHAFASMLIESGRNIVQVSRLLGHHSPSFTLSVYAHLMDGGDGGPLDVTLGGECEREREHDLHALHSTSLESS